MYVCTISVLGDSLTIGNILEREEAWETCSPGKKAENESESSPALRVSVNFYFMRIINYYNYFFSGEK